MPSFKVDLSETKEFKTPDEGTYMAAFRTIKVGTSQAGNSMLTIMLELTEAFDPGNDEFVGQNVFDHPVTEGPGAWRIGQIMEAAFGHKPEPDEEFNTDDFTDLPVLIEIIHEVWEEEDGGDGSVRARISKYKMAEGGGII
jgi:hypothetical protein